MWWKEIDLEIGALDWGVEWEARRYSRDPVIPFSFPRRGESLFPHVSSPISPPTLGLGGGLQGERLKL